MIDEEFIESIRETRKKWAEAENELKRIKSSRPFNQVSVSSVYGALTAIGASTDAKLLVIVYLFTPEVLAGVAMRRGYREFISTLFGYKSGCAISKRMKNLMFRYKNYKNFRIESDKGIGIAENVLKSIKK